MSEVPYDEYEHEVVFVSSAPSLSVSMKGETRLHDEGRISFVNGRFATTCKQTIDELRNSIKTKPNVSQLVHEVNKQAGIDMVRDHQEMMRQRTSRAASGSLTSSGLRQNAVENLFEQNRRELDAMMGGTEEERIAAAREIAQAGIMQVENTDEVVRNNDLKPDGTVLITPTPKVAIVLPAAAKAK